MALGVGRKELVMVGVLLTGTLLAVLNLTMLSPALPAIMSDLGVDATTAQWLTSVYALVEAVVIPLSAYLVGRFTTRQLFITALSVFTAGSLAAAVAPNFWVLLLGRIMQAACTGAVMPMVFTVILLVFPREKRGTAMGVIRTHHRLRPGGGAVAVGPSGGFRGLARAVRHCDGARCRRGGARRVPAAQLRQFRPHVFRQAVGGAVHGGPRVPALWAFHLRFYNEYGAHAGAYRRGHRAGGLLCASSA